MDHEIYSVSDSARLDAIKFYLKEIRDYLLQLSWLAAAGIVVMIAIAVLS